MDKNIIQNELNKIQVELLKIDTLINKKNDINLNTINDFNNLNKKFLLLKISIDGYKLDNNLKDIELQKQVQYISHNMKVLTQYINMSSDFKSRKSLDKLTILNTIFLPLGLICSYFGMNFKSMGSPTTKTGIFTINNSNKFVLFLFIISIIVTIIILII